MGTPAEREGRASFIGPCMFRGALKGSWLSSRDLGANLPLNKSYAFGGGCAPKKEDSGQPQEPASCHYPLQRPQDFTAAMRTSYFLLKTEKMLQIRSPRGSPHPFYSDCVAFWGTGCLFTPGRAHSISKSRLAPRSPVLPVRQRTEHASFIKGGGQGPLKPPPSCCWGASPHKRALCREGEEAVEPHISSRQPQLSGL